MFAHPLRCAEAARSGWFSTVGEGVAPVRTGGNQQHERTNGEDYSGRDAAVEEHERRREQAKSAAREKCDGERQPETASHTDIMTASDIRDRLRSGWCVAAGEM